MLVMPAAEIWRLAQLLVFQWSSNGLPPGCPGGFAIPNKDGQGGKRAVIKPAVKTQQAVGLVH